jgi:hypothetical protein
VTVVGTARGETRVMASSVSPDRPLVQGIPFFVISSLFVGFARADAPLRFDRDIRPILAENCFA